MPGRGHLQLPNRPIVRDGVGHGQDGLEVKAHMSIRCEYPLGLVLRPVGVLHVVQAFLIGLPNLVLSCATASPCTPLTLPRTRQGCPFAPLATSSPKLQWGASSTWWGHSKGVSGLTVEV